MSRRKPQPAGAAPDDLLRSLLDGAPANGSPLRQQVKQDVFARIRTHAAGSEPAAGVTVRVDAQGWRALAPGIEVKVLHSIGAVSAYLMRLAAGARIPPHEHPLDEECVVIAGSIQIGESLVLTQGDYHLAHEGTAHGESFSAQGALLYLRGASSTIHC